MGTKCSVTKTFRRLIILRPQYSSPQNLCLVGQDDLEEDARDFFENLEAARSFEDEYKAEEEAREFDDLEDDMRVNSNVI